MAEGFTGWAVLELMGHQMIAGEVREEVIGGPLIRVDVPAINGAAAFTRFYSPSALYSLTPVSEEIARKAAERLRPRAVAMYFGEERLLPPAADGDEIEDDPDDEIEDHPDDDEIY